MEDRNEDSAIELGRSPFDVKEDRGVRQSTITRNQARNQLFLNTFTENEIYLKNKSSRILGPDGTDEIETDLPRIPNF
jgi:hypothetical protein